MVEGVSVWEQCPWGATRQPDASCPVWIPSSTNISLLLGKSFLWMIYVVIQIHSAQPVIYSFRDELKSFNIKNIYNYDCGLYVQNKIINLVKYVAFYYFVNVGVRKTLKCKTRFSLFIFRRRTRILLLCELFFRHDILYEWDRVQVECRRMQHCPLFNVW